MNKRAQSAMEYLMTYGWAILVVLIALGALFYLGVFTPKVPNTCQADNPFTCIGGDIQGVEVGNIEVGGDTLTFNIGVGGGITVPVLTGITINGVGVNLGDCGDITLTPGNQKTITCTALIGAPGRNFFDAQGEKFSGTMSFTHTSAGGFAGRVTTGTFSGTTE